MKIGVFSPQIGWGTRQLLLTGKKFCATHYLSPRDFNYTPHNLETIFSFDAIILKGINQQNFSSFKLEFLIALEEQNFLFVNSISSILKASNKLGAALAFKKNGLPTPPTLFTTDIEHAVDFLNTHKQVLCKPIYGKGGKGIELIRLNPKDINKLTQILAKTGTVFLQKFINCDKDIRTFVVGDTVLGAMYRQRAENCWVTNINAGGTPIFCPLDDQLIQLSLKATKAFGLTVSGVDIMPIGEGRYTLLEINGCPGWKGLSEVNPTNFAEKIIGYITKNVGYKNRQVSFCT
jgi:RimK family alpha-L-glutamate ligase